MTRPRSISGRIDIVALISVILALISTVAAIIVVPEIRRWFGLERDVITTPSPPPSSSPYPTSVSIPAPSPIVSRRTPAPIPNEMDYRRLVSPAFQRQFIGKTVTFRAKFLSEWNLVDVYRMAGIQTEGRIFLNHRAPDYSASGSALGSSDGAYPAFPASVDRSQADSVYSLQRGDEIVISGFVEEPPNRNLEVVAPIHVRIRELHKTR